MKTFRVLTVLAMAVIALAGCSKDSDSPTDGNNNNNTPTESLTMKVNGTAWDYKGQQGSAVYGELNTGMSGSKYMNIKAVKYINPAAFQYDNLLITIDNPGVGTFTLGSSSSADHYATFQQQTSSTKIDLYQTLTAAASTVTITKYDKVNHLISGTFEFTATVVFSSPEKTVVITEGKFTDVKWEE